MKHPINSLLNNTDILCHEVRYATKDDVNLLLHFFTCHDKDAGKPYFAMGFEQYTPELIVNREFATSQASLGGVNKTLGSSRVHNNVEADQDWDEKTSFGYLSRFGMITQYDSESVLNQNTYAKHTTGLGSFNSQTNNLSDPTVNNPYPSGGGLNKSGLSEFDQVHESVPRISEQTYAQDASSVRDDSVKPSNRHIREMDDTPLYSGVTSRDSNISDMTTDTNYQADDGKKHHNIWNADIHFSKNKQVSLEELSYLFTKYRIYIGKTIEANLNKESKFNIEMEQLFGASFDLERIKTNMFRKDETGGVQHANSDNRTPINEFTDFFKNTAHTIREKVTNE